MRGFKWMYVALFVYNKEKLNFDAFEKWYSSCFDIKKLCSILLLDAWLDSFDACMHTCMCVASEATNCS